MQIVKQQRDFWESFGISLDDIYEQYSKKKGKISNTLANKLESQSKDWSEIVTQTYGVKGDNLKGIVASLYKKSKSDFIDLFALSKFAHAKINPTIIYDFADKNLKGKLHERAANKTVDSAPILLPLWKQNPKILENIFYEFLIQRSSVRKFENEKPIHHKISIKNLTFETISSYLQEYENSRKVNSRREIKLWWFAKDSNRIKLMFRREKGARSSLKLVERNAFLKTGDEKILVLSEDGKSLQIVTRREPKSTFENCHIRCRKVDWK